MRGAAVRRRAEVLLGTVLLTMVLSGCATRDRVDLPQIEDLRADLLAYSPKVLSVNVYHFSTAPFLSIDIDGDELSREDAFALVDMVRETVTQEDFQRDYYDERNQGDGWEPVISGRYYPDDINVSITTDGCMYEFESQLFSDGTPATGGKGEEFDGYSTWWGAFYQDGRIAGYFTHEDIFG